MQPRMVGAFALVAVLGGLAPERADAQVAGLPVYNSGVPRGLGLSGEVGFANDDAGKGTAFGLIGRAGLGAFGATAMISTFNPDGPPGSDVSVGATANLKVFGGPLIPLSVTLQGGIGYHKPDDGVLLADDVSQVRFPVGLGIALTIPNPALAIRPWLAPRVDVVRTSVDGDANTETNFALSGGVEFNTLSGFGAHAAYDLTFADADRRPGVLGLGLHYNFRVPGL